MSCAQCSHLVKSKPSCGTFQELKTLVGIDVDPTALDLATGRLVAQKPPATQLHLLPGNVRCARSSASGCQCAAQSIGPAMRRHLLCHSAAWQRLQLTLPLQLLRGEAAQCRSGCASTCSIQMCYRLRTLPAAEAAWHEVS